MPTCFLFADEAGNFDFCRNRGASRYFILATVAMPDPSVGMDLVRLRHDLLARGKGPDRAHFHAAEEEQATRDRVFAVLSRHQFRVDATILEKCKAQPQTRTSHATFYQYAWFYHMQKVSPLVASSEDTLVVIGASIGERRKQVAFRKAVESVAKQTSRAGKTRVACWPASCNPCLQVADYCCWAIQRKWEGNDDRSYKLIANKIRTEFDLWARGTVNFY